MDIQQKNYRPHKKSMQPPRLLTSQVWIHALVLGTFFLLGIRTSTASSNAISAAASLTNEDCFTCHGDKTATRGNGTSVYVDKEVYAKSIHGQTGQECVSCHADLASLKEPPHADKLAHAECGSCHEKAQQKYNDGAHARQRKAGNSQSATCANCHGTHNILPIADASSKANLINLPETCGVCHSKTYRAERTGIHGPNRQNIYDLYIHSVHGKVLKRVGLTVTAVCSSCHNAHDIREGSDPQSTVARKNIPHLCGKCHGGIFVQFMKSVHGKDFLAGVRDVPVCTDCHSEHSIQGPGDVQSSVSAQQVALTCSRCHEDMALARTYGMASSRLSTYSGSYHGIAMNFGMNTVANCASCHGVHDILPSSDPMSSINPAHLTKTCGKCHIGAGTNFAILKVHQVNPEADNFWAFWIKKLYIWMITAVIGGFLLFISADLFGRARRRRQHAKEK
jgi:predicted CXXCH cytochrome family protein